MHVGAECMQRIKSMLCLRGSLKTGRTGGIRFGDDPAQVQGPGVETDRGFPRRLRINVDQHLRWSGVLLCNSDKANGEDGKL